MNSLLSTEFTILEHNIIKKQNTTESKMSTNHFSTEAPWWPRHHHHNHQHMMEPSLKPSSRNPKNPSFFSNSQIYPHPMNFTNNPPLTFNLNHEDNHNNEDLEKQITNERVDKKDEKHQEYHSGEEQFIMPIKQFLFEKPLTPSDVGKLNRLVIPKQHAEKYFPLNGNSNSKINNESGGGSEKGSLLNFEDELGKSWRFRYSYWHSSQSYVLTKGWSRFIKEKKLDAGDIVFFESHHRFDENRFYIGWRRRGTPANNNDKAHSISVAATIGGGVAGGGGWNHMLYPHPSQSSQHQSPYQTDCLHAGSNVQNETGSASSIGQAPKTLRLFGVNMECQSQRDDVESEPNTPDGLTHGSAQYHHLQDQQFYYYSKLNGYEHQNHMDMNNWKDVKQMRYWRG